MARKQISFDVSDDQHAKIKELAAKERRSIKQLFLEMLDRVYPGGSDKEHELKIEPMSKK